MFLKLTVNIYALLIPPTEEIFCCCWSNHESNHICICMSILACSLLVTELEASIATVDSRKTIQIGSFRVDPNGNQDGLNEVVAAAILSFSFTGFAWF